MTQQLTRIAIVVRDYDEAIAFYTQKLGFELIEDTRLSDVKRWVVVSPPGSECALLLAKAASNEQATRIGNQTGGRVFLFLYTDDFERDFNCYRSNGIKFIRDPKEEPYGRVAVFVDLYGNKWDLIEPAKSQ
ncbi:MAG: hypothetical protein DHS20C16_24000 [Phycisphaerae bacterium]|nr:MAG: hypothetical protein DHS20C16_24000 [Phycisphaerae bacterium]